MLSHMLHDKGNKVTKSSLLTLQVVFRFSQQRILIFLLIMSASLPSSLKSHTVNDYLVNNLSSLSHSEEREEDLEDLKLPVYRFEILKVGSGNNGNGNGGSIVILQIYC